MLEDSSANLLPVAIVLAAVIVAGAVIFAGLYAKEGEFGSSTADVEEAAEKPAAVVSPEQEEEPSVPESPKADVPEVELFVMSYCPYGLQMQKGFLPVYQLLSGKADMSVRFVDYIMHDKREIDENLRQHCIQEQGPAEYAVYLNCFLKEGEVEGCLTEAKVNQSALTSCIEVTDKEYSITEHYEDASTWLNGSYPPFDIDAIACQEYGVRGSPTLVINGQQAQVNRSPEAIKQAVCQSFNNSPSECSQTLSSDNPSSGFGFGTAPTGTGGGCE